MGLGNYCLLIQGVFNIICVFQPLHSQRKPSAQMKNFNTILNVVSLAAIAVLFFLFFKHHSPAKNTGTGKDTGKIYKPGSIAYFEMDTIEQHYNYIKDVREQIKAREQSITNDLNNTKKNYMARIQELQGKAPTMSQQEGESAQAEINQMQLDMQQKEADLSQQLQDHKFKLMQDINKKIEDFLLVYNQEKKYVYIFSHQAGDFIYFKDSTNDITQEIIKGLNEGYKKAEK